MVVESLIDVRLPDCDCMNVVHHAVYPLWYEIGRMDLFKATGFDFVYAHIENGVDPACVNLNMNYGRPVTYPGTVKLKTMVTLCENKKIAFKYELYFNDDENPVCSATSFHIWVKNGKSINIEEAFPEMFAAYKAAVEEK